MTAMTDERLAEMSPVARGNWICSLLGSKSRAQKFANNKPWVKKMLDAGVSFSEKQRHKLIHRAVRASFADLIDDFVTKGKINPCSKDLNGFSALLAAANTDIAALKKILPYFKDDPDRQKHLDMALLNCAKKKAYTITGDNGLKETLLLLMDYGARMPETMVYSEVFSRKQEILPTKEYFAKVNRPEVVEALDEWEAREKRLKYMIENGFPVPHTVTRPKFTIKTQPPKLSK